MLAGQLKMTDNLGGADLSNLTYEQKKELVKERLENMINVFKHPKRELRVDARKLGWKCSMPEPISTDWIQFNNESNKIKFIQSAEIRPTPEQLDDACEVEYRLCRVCFNEDIMWFDKVKFDTIWLKTRGFSFYNIRDEFKKRGKKNSEITYRRMYNAVVDELIEILC